MPNVEMYEPILVTYGGQQFKCHCVGWNHLQDGSWHIKTNKVFGSLLTNKVPMEDVLIIISPRELRLRQELEVLKGEHEQKLSPPHQRKIRIGDRVEVLDRGYAQPEKRYLIGGVYKVRDVDNTTRLIKLDVGHPDWYPVFTLEDVELMEVDG